MPDPTPKTVTVEAQPGRTVPLHPDDHPDGAVRSLLQPGERCEVYWTTAIRRRIRAGDLALVSAAATIAAPAAPDAK